MSLRHRVRRGLTAVVTGGLAASALAVLTATPAHADTVNIVDAQLRWGVNNESNNRAFFGFNFFSAGKLGDPGAGGQQLKDADQGATWGNGAAAGWSATSGNVSIEKLQLDGSYATTTWAQRNTDVNGTVDLSPTNAVYSGHQVVIDNGVGTLDPDTDDAQLTWDGDFTVVYYSGLTFFYVSDPELTVADGQGEVTATLSGYGADMNDPTAWVALTPTEVTLATLSDVDVTADGLTVTPDYLGVEYDAPSGATAQSRTGASWGAFPQDFVDFQQLTGQSSYWYSSGGSTDAGKVALPLQVVAAAPPSVTVSQTTVNADGSTTVTVEGTGFNPSAAIGTRPPLAGRPSGVYVAFGKVADVWQPSAGAAASTRVNSSVKWAVSADDMATIGGAAAGAIELRPDGSFTAELTIDKAAIDAKATDAVTDYGIFTYAGGGAVQAAYETFTPITFPSVTVSRTAVPTEGSTTVTVEGTGFDPSAVIGTRPPLAGRPSGVYVAFGKVAESWRPSQGAASSTRVNSSVKWAVSAADMATIGGPAAGAIELRSDGSFTAELTIDKAAIDAKATDAVTDYGIFTYAGGGAVQSGYETFTPITFAPPVVVPATPTVSGDPKVGATLTADPGSWGPQGVTLSYQWYADDQPISGATAPTYVVTAAQTGKALFVGVTGASAGTDSVTRYSARTAKVASGVVTIAVPTLKGKAKVGKRLTAVVALPAGFDPALTAVSYQWFKGGKAIAGADGATLKLGKRLAGKKVRVVVTVEATGYQPATVTSAAKKVKR